MSLRRRPLSIFCSRGTPPREPANPESITLEGPFVGSEVEVHSPRTASVVVHHSRRRLFEVIINRRSRRMCVAGYGPRTILFRLDPPEIEGILESVPNDGSRKCL